MKLKSIKKWSWRLLLLWLLLTAAFFIWFDHEIDQFFGKHTTVVDHQQFSQPQRKLAIINVSVLSADAEQMLPGQTVVINQGNIEDVGTEVTVPQDAILIDGQGQFLIPGLIDSHVHLWDSANDLLLYVANGVTHVRELSGSETHLDWKQQVAAGRVGPDLFVTTGRLNSNGWLKAWFDQWTAKINSVRDTAAVSAQIQAYADQGYDAVKVYTFLENDHYWAVNEAAQNIDIPVLGHLPIKLGFDAFWQSNQKELAHIEEIVKELSREFGGYDDPNAAEFLAFVDSRKDQIAERLVQHRVAVVSTLWLMESFVRQKLDLVNTLKQTQLPYANPGLTEGTLPSIRVLGWLPAVNIYRLPEGLTSEQLPGYEIYWETYAEANRMLLRAMASRGVIVLAGTDANVPVAVPGFSMHDELQSMVAAGLSHSQALRSATSAPAAWMRTKSGKVLSGYRANLLLLQHNPLDDISHTSSIEAVIKDGRWYDRQQLDAMLNAVKQANDDSRTIELHGFGH